MKAYTADAVFDGTTLHHGWAVGVADGVIARIGPAADFKDVRRWGEGIIAPGFVDLQVNGGGGRMFGAGLDHDGTTDAGLDKICAAHRAQGTTTLLPTLITDTAAVTRRAIEAAIAAGMAGLHLEGPHLAVARKGAHDGSLIRPMEAEDEALYLHAAAHLRLMVTVAPESVTPDQVTRLAEAGVVVSLGHSDANYGQCMALIRAGARCVTHLFNAMSQMQGRAPGLVGAALASGSVDVGIIADGVHVDPVMLALALRAKQGPGRLFLVTDAMAVAGTAAESFTLGGRRIHRKDGRLRLADGTLAGADLRMDQAVGMIHAAGATVEQALAMATSIPADLMGLPAGHLRVGAKADMILLQPDLRFSSNTPEA